MDKNLKAIQKEKIALRPGLAVAFHAMKKLQHAYRKAEDDYLILKKPYEELDRREKLLLYASAKKKVSVKKKSKDLAGQAKKRAIKALDSLPKELRAQILANYKG